MANLSDLDLANVEAAPARRLLPIGEYQATVIDSEMKKPKSGGNPMLVLTIQIQQPAEYSGMKVWDNLNIKHANSDVANIARRQLKALMEAVGRPNAGESVELHDRLFTVTIGHREDKGQTYPQVKGYSPKRSGGQPLTQTSYPAPSAGPANPFG